MDKVISQLDKDILVLIRNNVSAFLTEMAGKYDRDGLEVLDIAPEVHEGTKFYFKKADVKTLDIDPQYNTDYMCDLCTNNENIIPNGSFDICVCTEVLEHVSNPFSAVKEIKRILKGGGIALISTPFNFRIHGPLPDCWRFTIHGLKELFKDFEILDLRELEADNRFLMPYHYVLEAKKCY
ncbi:hypothetical protein AGMMS49944_24330 [Spirochaetia bacterium]|nr:hypothetical protein AGMMS49944_24330 [Spirochaetia bacterium]